MFRKQDGSTLLLVMITVAILSILGTALISMSMMNVSMRKSDLQVKRSKYYAESGIDQVYARVADIVMFAIEDSGKKTDDHMDEILDKIDQIINYSYVGKDVNGNDILINEPSAHPEYDTYKIYFDETNNYALVFEKLEDESKRFFKGLFTGYLNNLVTTPNYNNSIKGILEQPYQEITTDSNSTITIGSVEGFDMAPYDRLIIKDVKSEFLYRNKTRKEITTDIIIYDEVNTYPLNTLEERITIKDNPIWQKAIVSSKDVKLNGNSTVKVNGDVYAIGTSSTNIDDATGYGGLIVKDNSNLKVNGDVISGKYVQLAPYSNASMTISGIVHANSIVAQKGSNGMLKIGEDAYTKDDLEHNGNSSKIVINGSYFGYSDGSSPSATHDSSSAIVINADLSKPSNPPKLIINGNDTGNERDNGIVIWGTAHINISPKFQSAESVAIKQNTLAYTWEFTQPTIEQIYSDSPFTYGKYKYYSSVSEQNNSINKYFSNPKWQSVNTSSGEVKIAKGSTIDGSNSSLSDRKAYFTAFQNYVDINDEFLSKGNGNIVLNNFLFSTGLQLNGDFNNKDSSQSVGEYYKNKLPKDYLYYLHNMNKRTGSEEAIETVLGSAPNFDNSNPVHKYTNIETPSSLVDNSFLLNKDKKIINYSNASGDTLNIYGPSYSGISDENNIYLDFNDVTGIIVRAGDINVYGSFSFNGPIISAGTINFMDGSNVTITNDCMNEMSKRQLAQMIYKNEGLYNIFQVSSYSDSVSDPIYLEEYEYIKVGKVEEKEDLLNNSLQTYSGYINFEHWRITK